ncbi:reverse transcriptase [Diaporthe eres]|nr:reverse transcriptase [Diaporthe eres]
MAAESAFLSLPRDLRDEVYRHYVTYEDGLVYNFEYDGEKSAKSRNILRNLAPANNRDPIDLGLRSTCKQVHRETEGLILKFNTITFSNTRISRKNSDEVRVRAARFHFLRVPLTMEAASFLYYEDGPVVRPCYTQAVVDEVVRTHPSIGPLLRTLLKENTHWAEINSAHKVLQARPHEHCPDEGPGPTGTWGIVRSSMRAALMHALKVTADHDCFGSGPAAERPTFSPREILALDSKFPAWSVPTDDDLLELSRPYAKRTTDVCRNGNIYCHASRQLHTAEFWNGPRYCCRYTFAAFPIDESDEAENRGKYRFSAASVAIEFLSSLPSGLRIYLRHMRLLENNISVAFPESHAHGLINFCVENPKLRVERRVNVWKTILQQPSNEEQDIVGPDSAYIQFSFSPPMLFCPPTYIL